MKKTVSVILTVHNKQDLIEKVLLGLLKNLSENAKELIIVLDGCTDNSEAIINKVLSENSTHLKIIFEYTPDVWEVKANNVGLKRSTCDFSLLVQDDMIVIEKDFDKRLLKPFMFSDVFAVTSRDAHNIKLVNNKIVYTDLVGKYNYKGRDCFAIRDVVNRGPLLLNNERLAKLNFLDEVFCPINQDDHDLCLRAYKQFGWVCGSYVIEYISEDQWGTTRCGKNSHIVIQSIQKNEKIIIERHFDLITGKKHDEEIIIL